MIHIGTTAVVIVCSPSLLIWMQECMWFFAILVWFIAIKLDILMSMQVELYIVLIMQLEMALTLISGLSMSSLARQAVS